MSTDPSSPRIIDAGRKIGGARKDIWKDRALALSDLEGMTPAEQYEHVTKDNVWPKPDWAAVVAAGMPAPLAAAVKVMRDGLAARPVTDTEAGRRAYIRMMGLIEARFMAIRQPDDWTRARDALVYEDLQWRTRKTDPEMKLVMFSVWKGRHEPWRLSPAARRKVTQMVTEGWPASAAKASKSTSNVSDGEDRKALPSRPHLDHLERVGTDWRDGHHVTAEDFVTTFGFYGVEWGNWLNDGERQQVADAAYDALMDLADVFDLPPAALSLGNSLGLAFGARGTGRAAAHYEPGRTVINLTRMSGAGSLAHEWAHAFDHFAGSTGIPSDRGKPHGGSGWYDRLRTPGSALPCLSMAQQAAWDQVMDTIHFSSVSREMALDDWRRRRQETVDLIATRRGNPESAELASWRRHMAQRLENIDEKLSVLDALPAGAAVEKRSSRYVRNAVAISGERGYWARPTELFARAFEAAVFDRLAAQGRRSDYLVHSVSHEMYDNPLFKGNPYPGGAERERIAAAVFDVVASMAPALAVEQRIEVDEAPEDAPAMMP